MPGGWRHHAHLVPLGLHALSIIGVAGRVVRKETKKEEGNKEGYYSVNKDL